MYEGDFVKDESVEFDIDGRKFSYKPATAKDENGWLKEYMTIDEKGKPKADPGKLNECKVRNIKSVPYDKETINKIIGVEKEWPELNNEEKYRLMGKLGSTLFEKILTAMHQIDNPDDLKKKDS